MTDTQNKPQNDESVRKGNEPRRLTSGELRLAESVFFSTIDYHRLWIHRGNYSEMGLGLEDIAKTPAYEIWFDQYQDDFSQTLTDNDKHLFIREMAYVWLQTTGRIKERELSSWIGSLSTPYTLDGRLLRDYRVAQRAQIIADNFILQTFGYNRWRDLRTAKTPELSLDGDISEPVIRMGYGRALRAFPW